MSKFIGSLCPVCEKELKNDDEIVVCPECGAPYHKECYKQEGKCIFDELHSQNKNYELTYPKKEEKAENTVINEQFEQQEVFKCSRCGAKNPSTGIFCEICGSPLNSEFAKQAQKVGAQNPYSNIPYNPFVSPFSGVDPEEEISGEKAKDIVVALGQNTSYFIPRFKNFSKKLGTFDFNWASLIFAPWYFFFRKMWLYGLLAVLITVVLDVPLVIANVFALLNISNPFLESGFFSALLIMFNFISLAFKFSCGLFTNKLYMHHLIKKMKKTRNSFKTPPENSELYKKYNKIGGTSYLIVYIIAGIYLLSVVLMMTVFPDIVNALLYNLGY